ncbi:MAG: hypothetical protein ACFFDP_11400 [Promethearchaeota archaeon]
MKAKKFAMLALVIGIGLIVVFELELPVNVQIGNLVIRGVTVKTSGIGISLGLEVHNLELSVLQIFGSDIDVKINRFTVINLNGISGAIPGKTSQTLDFSIEICWNLFELAELSQSEVILLGFTIELIGILNSNFRDIPVQEIIEITADML